MDFFLTTLQSRLKSLDEKKKFQPLRIGEKGTDNRGAIRLKENPQKKNKIKKEEEDSKEKGRGRTEEEEFDFARLALRVGAQLLVDLLGAFHGLLVQRRAHRAAHCDSAAHPNALVPKEKNLEHPAQTDRQTDRNGFKWIELGKNSVNRPFKHGSPKQPGKAANHSRKTTKKNDQRRKPGSEIATQTNVELKQTQEIEPLRAFNPEIRPFKYDKNQEMRNSTSAYLVCLHRVILACSPRPATALDQTGSEEESPNRLEICANINYAVNTTSSQPEMVLTGKYGSAQ